MFAERRSGRNAHFLVAVLLASGAFASISVAAPRHVAASEGSEGCNPQRTSDASSHPFYFDGWMVNPTTSQNTSLGGVSMKAVAYSPYVLTGSSGTDTAVAAWAMLDDAANSTSTTGNYAQTGYLEWPGNSPPSYTREYFMEINGPNGYSHFNYWNNTSPWQPDISTSHTYNTLWDPSSTNFTFQVDGTTQYTYSGAGWTPIQAFVSGETHNAAEQMEGDIAAPLDMNTVGWVYGGSTTWHTFNYLSNAVFYYWMHYAGSSTLHPIAYMGGNVPSANEIKIWDEGCPNQYVAGLDTSNNLYVIPAVGAPWGSSAQTSVTQIAVSGSWIGYVKNGGFYIWDKSSGTTYTEWTATTVNAISIGGGYIGIIADSGSNFYAKSGLTGSWTTEASGVNAIAMTSNYMLELQGGYEYGKVGLTGSWQTEWGPGASAIAGSNNYIGALDSTGSFHAKTGGLGGTWVTEAGCDKIDLSSNYIGCLTGGVSQVKTGGLYGSWVNESGGCTTTNYVTQMALGDNGLGALCLDHTLYIAGGMNSYNWPSSGSASAVAIAKG